MRIVVSDTSCLIDLRKVSLLEAFLRLPYEVLIPNTLFEDELVRFSATQKRALVRAGLQVVDLQGPQVLQAQAVLREAPKLSVHDGFAFVLAEQRKGILLTGDGQLRLLAQRKDVEVHGVLWVVDQLAAHGVCGNAALVSALTLFANDSTVRLPRRDLIASLKRLEGKLSEPAV